MSLPVLALIRWTVCSHEDVAASRRVSPAIPSDFIILKIGRTKI